MASDEAQEFRQKSSVGELAKAAVWRRDDKPHSGMIEALLTGIRDGAIDATKPLQISSVDSPWLQSKLYSKLRMSMGKNIDIVVPYCKTPHPLHSLVRVDPLNEAINPGDGPLKNQIKAMRWKAVDCTGQGLQNVNSPSDLRMSSGFIASPSMTLGTICARHSSLFLEDPLFYLRTRQVPRLGRLFDLCPRLRRQSEPYILNHRPIRESVSVRMGPGILGEQ